MKSARKILLVDDEQNVLDALQRQLRLRFSVYAAAGGKPALELIAKERKFDVIVSDMRMPEMDGIAFLERARIDCPDAVRMMLTGNADQETAVAAINKGAIFRFLNKPCQVDDLVEAICACGRQHDLIVAERELLESTLSGAVRTLMEVLSIVHPESFGKAQVLKSRASQLATHFGAGDVWAIELAAMFSRIGVIVVPPEILYKDRTEQTLSEYERRLMARIPALGAHLLANIPRLEGIGEMIQSQDLPYSPGAEPLPPVWGDRIPLGSRIIRVLGDLAELESRGQDVTRALFILRNRGGLYDPEILKAAEALFARDRTAESRRQVSLGELRPGMRAREDIVTSAGSLLVASGTVISEAAIERLRNFAPVQGVKEPIIVDRDDRQSAA